MSKSIFIRHGFLIAVIPEGKYKLKTGKNKLNDKLNNQEFIIFSKLSCIFVTTLLGDKRLQTIYYPCGDKSTNKV